MLINIRIYSKAIEYNYLYSDIFKTSLNTTLFFVNTDYQTQKYNLLNSKTNN